MPPPTSTKAPPAPGLAPDPDNLFYETTLKDIENYKGLEKSTLLAFTKKTSLLQHIKAELDFLRSIFKKHIEKAVLKYGVNDETIEIPNMDVQYRCLLEDLKGGTGEGMNFEQIYNITAIYNTVIKSNAKLAVAKTEVLDRWLRVWTILDWIYEYANVVNAPIIHSQKMKYVRNTEWKKIHLLVNIDTL